MIAFREWRDVLHEDYQWLVDITVADISITEIVRRIIESGGDVDVTEVYQSSIWAVAMAFLDYKEKARGFLVSIEEHRYARTRGGVHTLLLN